MSKILYKSLMRVAGMCAVGVTALCAATVCAQNYPARPVHLITAEAGGGADFLARLIAQELTASMGQQVIVENRGAAGGIIAAQTVAKAQPDGYTLLLYSGFIWVLPFMKSVPYDPVNDFLPITWAAGAPNILVVNQMLAANSVRELIALAKGKPGEFSYASSGSGGTPHLAAELFKSMAGISIVHVPYKGQAQALTDLIGGQIQIMFPNAAAVAPHLKAGRVKALGVTTAQPSALAPGLPTLAAAGLPGYESVVMFGIFAPVKTPPAISARLNEEIVRALRKPEVTQKLLNAGTEVVGSSADEFRAAIKADMARWSKVIRDANIRAD